MAMVKPTETPLSLRGVETRPRNGALRMSQPSNPVYAMPIPVKPVPYAKAKRVLDIVFSLVVMLAGLPLLLFVALMVKLTSRGPVIFKQTRVGVGGRHFTCYKFRSMCVDAEARRDKLMHLNEATGPVFKIKNDPRLTPIGRLLRKFSLDELPQFFNVLKGDMSIVGPRPPVPCEVEYYGAHEMQRLSVRPGLTCLWQINGRSDIPFEHWVELDLAYIETMSFWGDLLILVKTVPAVLTGRGAR
jgi:exopolysaccharide biosynthesis polyprenyl glycosylphosphotransferase